MISTINDLPVWVRELPRQVREYEAQDGQLYRQLRDGFEASRPVTTYVPLPVTRREAVAQFVDVAYALAATILQSPADYPAHALNYAIGLLHESLDYVKAEQAATQRGKHV